MQFKLNADGAMAAGQGIGNAIKAFAMGPQVRQQAAQSQEATLAKIYADNMQGNQYGANARKLTADATDQELTTRLREGIDAVHAIRLNAELGYSPEEGVQNLLHDAFKNLDSSPTLNGLDRKGLAVGAIYTIAALAAQAIQGADALVEAERLRTEAVELATAADIEQSQRLMARALTRRAADKSHEVAA